MAKYTVDTGVVYLSVETGPLTKATIIHLQHYVSGVGYAKLNVGEDSYDEDFGVELATARAQERMNRKLQKKLIKSLSNG